MEAKEHDAVKEINGRKSRQTAGDAMPGEAVCRVCFRQCRLRPGQTGVCRARKNENGKLTSANYGMVTSLALDPIEKKPLHRFYPGSRILSVGSFGCNLKCPFCQNVEISLADDRTEPKAEYLPPDILVQIADRHRPEGNIGLAFTYNEPLVGYEYVLDAARLSHERGMKNVLVTNGCISQMVLEQVLPYTDAMNIDLKCFSKKYYRDTLKGDFDMVREFIARAALDCHVELTTLIIPGENDSEEEMREIAGWISELNEKTGKQIPLHISRFFPMSRYADRQPTPVSSVYRLAEVAREKLRFVYEGNV